MKLSRRRVAAVFRKELRDLRRNGNVVYAMVVLPLVFLVQPVIGLLVSSPRAAAALRHEHPLVYMLAVPALVPAALAAYSIVGERVQGTLEPLLTTPVARRELVLGKALAALLPSVVVAYAVFALYVALVGALAAPGIATAVLRWPDIAAQLVFTPLLALWSIWVGMAISARMTDVRTASQISVLVSLPAVAVTSLIAFNVIPAELRVALGFGVGLSVLDRVGWVLAVSTFDRERLIVNTK